MFTPEDVRQRGIAAITAEAVAVAGNGCDIYASVDVDAVDGGYVAMTGVPQLDGSGTWMCGRRWTCSAALPVGALDLCGLNPLVEVMSLGKTGQRFGVHLILRFLYQRLFPMAGPVVRPWAGNER